MIDLSANYLSIVIASAVVMFLGFFWYSPALFGNLWMELNGFTKDSMEKAKKGMGGKYALMVAMTVVTSFVLYKLMMLTGSIEPMQAIGLAFLLWLGFEGSVQMTGYMFGGRPFKLYVIDTGFQLASLIIMALIFSYLG